MNSDTLGAIHKLHYAFSPPFLDPLPVMLKLHQPEIPPPPCYINENCNVGKITVNGYFDSEQTRECRQTSTCSGEMAF